MLRGERHFAKIMIAGPCIATSGKYNKTFSSAPKLWHTTWDSRSAALSSDLRRDSDQSVRLPISPHSGDKCRWTDCTAGNWASPASGRSHSGSGTRSTLAVSTLPRGCPPPADLESALMAPVRSGSKGAAIPLCPTALLLRQQPERSQRQAQVAADENSVRRRQRLLRQTVQRSGRHPCQRVAPQCVNQRASVASLGSAMSAITTNC